MTAAVGPTQGFAGELACSSSRAQQMRTPFMIRKATATRASARLMRAALTEKTHKLKSNGFRLWLLHAYYRNTSWRSQLKRNVDRAAHARSTRSGMTDLSVKSSLRAAACDDKIYIDLCVITAGARLRSTPAAGESSTSRPCAFRRSPGMPALPEPERRRPPRTAW